MVEKSLESFIENSWDFAKKVIGSSRAKKAASVVVGGIAYLGFGEKTNAQVSIPIDSISISAEYGPENRGPQRFRESIWELKNGIPQIRKTIDLGIIKIDGPPWELPALVHGSGFGVKYQSSEWDTILVKFKVYRHPENTPIEGAGANIFNAYGGFSNPDIDGIHLGVSGNYLDPASDLITNEKGEAQMRLRIKVQKAPATIDSMVTVLFPNGGEDLVGGSTQEVSLENNYNGDNFKLSFSTDKGNTWNVMANGIESKYNWKIPGDVSSDDCLVKAEDGKNSKVYDVSDGVFSIAPETIDSMVTVLFPNNGEQILGASEQEISWENNYNGDNFKVSFSNDNGKTWEYIDNGTEFKDGSSSVMKYDWKIPNDIASDSCLVKVEDDKNSKVYDISDEVFSVDIDTGIESTVLGDKKPNKFSVSQNYPNPFNPATKFQYELANSASNVKITIYDALCRKVEEFNEGSKGPGIYEATWKPGNGVASGMYFFKVDADGKAAIKKMIFQK